MIISKELNQIILDYKGKETVLSKQEQDEFYSRLFPRKSSTPVKIEPLLKKYISFKSRQIFYREKYRQNKLMVTPAKSKNLELTDIESLVEIKILKVIKKFDITRNIPFNDYLIRYLWKWKPNLDDYALFEIRKEEMEVTIKHGIEVPKFKKEFLDKLLEIVPVNYFIDEEGKEYSPELDRTSNPIENEKVTAIKAIMARTLEGMNNSKKDNIRIYAKILISFYLEYNENKSYNDLKAIEDFRDWTDNKIDNTLRKAKTEFKKRFIKLYKETYGEKLPKRFGIYFMIIILALAVSQFIQPKEVKFIPGKFYYTSYKTKKEPKIITWLKRFLPQEKQKEKTENNWQKRTEPK